jgi:cyclase
LADVPYRLGAVQLTDGCYAWLQPDGGWGLSNAGLIIGEGAALLVDTLFDLPHTQRMLTELEPLTASAPITTVVNTHGNGDHWFGNELVADAEIIAAEVTAQEMRAVGPDSLVSLLGMPGDVGDYARQIFGRYEFAGITPTYPTRTFSDQLVVSVGGVDVVLINVGPAHTGADTVVYCERDGVVFTGDIVFAGGTPIVWAGPLSNWVAACDRILGLDARILVPGHGPVCTPTVVRTMIDYLQFVQAEAASRFAAGVPAIQAAADIDLGGFADLPENERLVVNVIAAYRELAAAAGVEVELPSGGPPMFGCMAELNSRHSHRPH